jgi:hypothetical protein
VTPAQGFVGTVTFRYSARNAAGRQSAPATVTVRVGPQARILMKYASAGDPLYPQVRPTRVVIANVGNDESQFLFDEIVPRGSPSPACPGTQLNLRAISALSDDGTRLFLLRCVSGRHELVVYDLTRWPVPGPVLLFEGAVYSFQVMDAAGSRIALLAESNGTEFVYLDVDNRSVIRRAPLDTRGDAEMRPVLDGTRIAYMSFARNQSGQFVAIVNVMDPGTGVVSVAQEITSARVVGLLTEGYLAPSGRFVVARFDEWGIDMQPPGISLPFRSWFAEILCKHFVDDSTLIYFSETVDSTVLTSVSLSTGSEAELFRYQKNPGGWSAYDFNLRFRGDELFYMEGPADGFAQIYSLELRGGAVPVRWTPPGGFPVRAPVELLGPDSLIVEYADGGRKLGIIRRTALGVIEQFGPTLSGAPIPVFHDVTTDSAAETIAFATQEAGFAVDVDGLQTSVRIPGGLSGEFPTVWRVLD